MKHALQWRVYFKRPIMFGTTRSGIERDEVIAAMTLRLDHSDIAQLEVGKIDYDSIDWEKSDQMTRDEFNNCFHSFAVSEAYEEAVARAEHVCAQIAEHGEAVTHRGVMNHIRLAYSAEGSRADD